MTGPAFTIGVILGLAIAWWLVVRVAKRVVKRVDAEAKEFHDRWVADHEQNGPSYPFIFNKEPPNVDKPDS